MILQIIESFLFVKANKFVLSHSHTDGSGFPSGVVSVIDRVIENRKIGAFRYSITKEFRHFLEKSKQIQSSVIHNAVFSKAGPSFQLTWVGPA